MVRTFLILTAVVLMGTAVPVAAQSAKTSSKAIATDAKAAPAVTVYYFHTDRRCATCMAVENTTKDFVAKKYGKSGEVVFKTVNVEDDANAALAEKYQAAGSLLLVVSGDKTEDLTADAFKYARTSPEKLESKLKKSISGFMN